MIKMECGCRPEMHGKHEYLPEANMCPPHREFFTECHQKSASERAEARMRPGDYPGEYQSPGGNVAPPRPSWDDVP